MQNSTAGLRNTHLPSSGAKYAWYKPRYIIQRDKVGKPCVKDPGVLTKTNITRFPFRRRKHHTSETAVANLG